MTNRVLLAIDTSNFEYACIWAAHSDWCKSYPGDASVLRPAEETDQEDLPDLLNYESFRRVLSRIVQKKIETLIRIAKDNHQAEIDIADGLDVIFSEDSDIDNNFRKVKYPEYKAQRKLKKNQFKIFPIKEYIQNVIFKELKLESDFHYNIVKIDGCESDDIIAVLMKRFNDYICRIIISSDHDFLQLENVYQYDLQGNPVERKLKSKNYKDAEMTIKEFLLWKILRGDVSDNIKNVFSGCADVKSYKLVKDKPRLKQMLIEDQEAANRFRLNKMLIDFNSIPEEMENRIFNVLSEKLKREETDKVEEFNLEGCIEL